MAPASPDLRYNLSLPMQKDSNPNAQWHVGVPNGNYAVTVVAGSPSGIEFLLRNRRRRPGDSLRETHGHATLDGGEIDCFSHR